ncbi:MAG: hypothetical protein ABI782_10565 [Anaerolineaceae bacterium]
MRSIKVFAASSLAALAILGAAACSDSKQDAAQSTPSPAAAAPTTAGAAATIAATTSAAGASASTAPSTAPSTTAIKVSANNSTRAQLTAAFEAAGIPNPANWAKEVEEYRPYPANDPDLTRLRQNLVKYNPPAGVVDRIVATLSLDR